MTTDEDDVCDLIMEKIQGSVDYLRTRHPNTLIHFTNITGVDVLKTCAEYAGPRPQKVLDNIIWILNDFIEGFNLDYGTSTPDMAAAVHTGIKPNYNLLNDSPNGTLACQKYWALELLDHMKTHY